MPKAQPLKRNYTFTEDQQNELFDFLKAKFPEAIEDNEINFETLQEILSDKATDLEQAEHFGLNWVGKRDARRLAMKPPQGTLKPCPGEGINEDTTENIFIEGENLEVLKILRQSYRGKIKMIYIDPPYNTGNDFVYKDNFIDPLEDYLKKTGQKSEGGLLSSNPKSSGRFHTSWLNFMYPRLRIAKDFLTEDGVIFISIDDNEEHNLMQLLNEIFGEENFLGKILWKKKTNGNNMGYIPPVHDYFLAYAKKASDDVLLGFPLSQEYIERNYSNPDNDPRGQWTTSDLSANHVGPHFPIDNPQTGEVHYPPTGRYWVFNPEEVKKRIKEGRIIFGKSGEGKPIQKKFLSERKSMRKKAESWWDKHGMNSDGTAELAKYVGAKVFSHPKPSITLKHLCQIATRENDIIMDFFAGTGTTAHAVLSMNKESESNRKFICIQLPEKTADKSVAKKQGFDTISQVSEHRIKNVISEMSDESFLPGFKKCYLSKSNFRQWQPVEQILHDLTSQLNVFEQNPLEDGWRPKDIITEVTLNEGFPLHSKIEETNGTYRITSDFLPYTLFINLEEKIKASTIAELGIGAGDTFVCLDKAIDDEIKLQLDDSCNLKTI